MTELPEIPESDAEPDLQVLYVDIKTTAGTAMVNLIYRHIATIPDALPWVWDTIKSGIGYDQINVAAQGLPVIGFGQPLPESAFALLGLTGAEVRTATTIVTRYNSANALNIVTLAALRRILDQIEDGAAVELHPASPTEPSPLSRDSGLPPIVPMSMMDPETTGLVRRLAYIGNVAPEDHQIIPSLYRHLAHWPAYLALMLAVLEPLSTSGAIETARRQVVASAERAGRPLAEAALARGVAPVPANARLELKMALDVFVERIIPKMLPIGHTLVALTPTALHPKSA
tara:strand:- start:1430 stop:2290 length:861 start_codon:yes stop_codon:yes gene_type:complete